MKELKILVRIDELGNRTISAKESTGFNTDGIEDNYEMLGIFEYLKMKQLMKLEKLTKTERFKGKEK